MPAEVKGEIEFEIAHVLFIDTVGYSKLLINDQRRALEDLKTIVRGTTGFQAAQAAGKLIRLPTGDGMALVFAENPEAPVRCAMEISRAARAQPGLPLRMGIHSGPVSRIVDVNDRINIAGAGINTAERVMSCGDAGHVLLSKRAASDLAEYGHWQPFLHDLGEFEAKHGAKIGLVNFYNDEVGNPELPSRLKQTGEQRAVEATAQRVVFRRRLSIATSIALALLVLGIVGYNRLHRTARPRAGSLSLIAPDKSIAVLPFQNLTDDKQNAYLADGIVDEILTDLARVADLKVISRTSVMQYRAGGQRVLRDIASALGVAHVLEGTVRRSGDRLRINVQLIDARTDTQVWAQRYDREVADVFAIESELAQAIVAQLQSKLSPAEKAAIETKPTADMAAYDLYVQAKTLLAASSFTQGREKRSDAVLLLDDAVRRDPKFLLAYSSLVRVHSEFYLLGMDHTRARLDKAEAALQAALRLGAEAGETHLASAFFLYCNLDYDRARSELVAARSVLPNEPLVFEVAGYIYRRQGQWEESARNLARALDLDPRNFYFLQQIAQSYEKQRRFDDMRVALDRALALVPGDPGVRVSRAAIDFSEHADAKPLRKAIDEIVAENPQMKQALAVDSIRLALCERDFAAAQRALAAMPATGGSEAAFVFPRAWYAGLIARSKGDSAGARAAFSLARVEVEHMVAKQSDYAQPFSVLGMIDAALGNKDRAVQEGRRASSLLPITKDAINGVVIAQQLAATYAWCGEKERALEELTALANIPSDLSYGALRLDPVWDSLRGNPRFEEIVARLAPKQP